MDPFTQGIVGTTVAQSGSRRDTLIICLLYTSDAADE